MQGRIGTVDCYINEPSGATATMATGHFHDAGKRPATRIREPDLHAQLFSGMKEGLAD
jgi:hypothetical protein